MADPTPYQPTVLDASGEATPWLDLGASTHPAGAYFACVVSGAPEYQIQVATDERGSATADKADQSVLGATMITGGHFRFPRGPRYGRVKMTGGTGSVTVSWDPEIAPVSRMTS